MIKKLLLSLGVIFLVTNLSLAQQSTFKGVVQSEDGKPVEYAQVFLEQDGKVVNLAWTDSNGEYQMPGVTPGTYTLRVQGPSTCPGIMILERQTISSGATAFVNFEKLSCVTGLPPVRIIAVKPLIDPSKTEKVIELDGRSVASMPGRSVTSAIASMEGVTKKADGTTSIRGNRSDGQQTIIDGVRVRGTSGISMSSLESISLIQGGVPPEYGDGTSFTVITTRGVPNVYTGNFELRGSLEGYNNFLAAAFVTGPLLKGKKETDPARIGFMIGAEGGFNQDSRPLHGGSWIIKDEALERIQKTPLLYDDPFNIDVYHLAAEYLQEDDFEKRRVRKNAYDWNYLVQAKVDFLAGGNENQVVKPIRISLGGSYEFRKYKDGGYRSAALMNYANHSEIQQSTIRANARMSHRVYQNFGDSSLLKNVMYDINVSFTHYKELTQDPNHKDNLFRYGHVGYFEAKKAVFYERQDEYQVIDTVTGNVSHIWYGMNVQQVAPIDTLISFRPGSYNPYLSAYTQNFYDKFTPEYLNEYGGFGGLYNIETYRHFGALMNGDDLSTVYGLYSVPGVILATYRKNEITTIGAKANLAITLKNHEIKLGFEFDRASYRGYAVNAYNLWTLMRNLQNAHMIQMDVNNPIIVRDTIKFNQYVNEAAQSTFDRNLRTVLGYDPSGHDGIWLDIDNYEPEKFSLDMFSAEELLLGTSTGTNPMVSYYGYDYKGDKYRGKTSIKDFFQVNENGVREYNIGTYDPIYMAMYIQDNFTIQNLRFNIGVRIDRFDANQDVLKDPFLFREGVTIADLRDGKGNYKGIGNQYTEAIANGQILHSSEDPNRYDNYVVYVGTREMAVLDGRDEFSPSDIVAYRSGMNWFNAQGQEVTNPDDVVGTTGGPLLMTTPDPNDITKVSAGAFEDYKPQWGVMPRLSFSFPVSDNSLFTAHYNIMTYRPSDIQISPINYLFIEKIGSTTNPITNPNLRLQKSIDYEIGFNQKVGQYSAVGISAYYSEKRDQVQIYRYTGAYPTTYYSFANIDFGTVQGFSFSYLYRNNRNLSLRASYTIQFAKGTGSDSESQASIVQSGQPNLRTLTNLEFDQRHRISGFIDYRFRGGADYDGPKTEKVGKDGKAKVIRWLENTGFTVVLSGGSGLPYSRSVTPYSEYISGAKAKYTGAMNGSFKPWTFQCDLRIDKSFQLKINKNAKDKDGNQKQSRDAMLMIYLDVQNIFNLKNILKVYEYTGNADDDGYLSATEFQKQIESQLDVASYINYYRMMVNNPYNYGTPAQVNLGIQFSF